MDTIGPHRKIVKATTSGRTVKKNFVPFVISPIFSLLSGIFARNWEWEVPSFPVLMLVF